MDSALVESYRDDPVFPFTYAPWARRIASAFVDLLVVTAISIPFLAPTLSRAMDQSTDLDATGALTASEIRTLTIISIVIQVGYFTAMHAWRGSTVGKMATRTVLVTDEGQRVSPGVAFIRAVSLVGINFVSGFLLLIPAIVNMLSPLWSPQNQTFHDRFAKTIVVLRENLTD